MIDLCKPLPIPTTISGVAQEVHVPESDPGRPNPEPSPEPSAAPAGVRSRLWVIGPLLCAFGFGASVFFPWLEGFGISVNAMDLRLDALWSDLTDFELEGAWLGPILLAIAVLGLVTILLRSVPAVFYRLVAILAIAVVAMFFRAAIAEDGFEFVEFGAYAAAGFALLMLIPRN